MGQRGVFSLQQLFTTPITLERRLEDLVNFMNFLSLLSCLFRMPYDPISFLREENIM